MAAGIGAFLYPRELGSNEEMMQRAYEQEILGQEPRNDFMGSALDANEGGDGWVEDVDSADYESELNNLLEKKKSPAKDYSRKVTLQDLLKEFGF